MFSIGLKIFRFTGPTNCCTVRQLHPALIFVHSKASTSQQFQTSNCCSIRKYYQLIARNISEQITEESLYNFYSKFGKVQEVVVWQEKKTHQFSAKVKFFKEEAVDQALDNLPHVIGDQELWAVKGYSEFKLFVANLPRDSSIEMVSQYFNKFGYVLHCKLVKEKNVERFSRMCDVLFATERGLKNALDARPLFIGTTELNVRPLRPKISTLHVGLLLPKTTEKSLKKYFSQFGNVEHCQVKKYLTTKYSLCSGYVTFSSPEELKRAVEAAPHTVDGKQISIADTSLGSNLHRSAEKSLFVSDIPNTLKNEDVEKFYSKFGQVKEVTRYYRATHWVAAVTFAEASQAKEALASRPHFITSINNSVKNKRVRVRPYYTSEDTLVVSGLHPRTSKYTIKQHFAQFGDLLHSELMVDRKVNKSHCVATVAYASLNGLEKALSTSNHEIDGKVLSIKRFNQELVDRGSLENKLIAQQRQQN